MKNKLVTAMQMLALVVLFAGCKKTYENYPGGTLSSFIAIYDIRNMYNGQDVTLTTENMFGAEKITGIVVSDHSGGNMPEGMLVVQDNRRLNQLRGIAIPLGSDASNYVPGDLVEINVTGAIVKREGGVLQLTGINANDIIKVSSGNDITIPIVKSNSVISNPLHYEGTLLSVSKVGFDASYPEGTTYAGDKIINDGFGNMILHTESNAEFANKSIPFMANYTGIIFPDSDGKPQLWARSNDDIMVLSATAPKVANIIITGYLLDPSGADKDYEYIQLMATKDINFEETAYSLVTTNNAGASTPGGFPLEGWATGGLRTYKINIASGSVIKGQYFYVGSIKKIWGASSTDISSSFWITKAYGTEAGDDFGSATTNLLANSGNAAGIAIFDTNVVTKETIPIDVLFYGGGGSIYTAGPPEAGYRITNTDYYDRINPNTLEDQPYFNMGSNNGKLSFPSPTGNFVQLKGVYNLATARWTSARTLNPVVLTNTSTVTEIEGGTTIEQ